MNVKQWLAAVILAGIVVAIALHSVADRMPGRYQLSASATGAWRLDTLSGNVSYCLHTGVENTPMCGPWGAQSLEQYRASRPPR